MSQPRAESAPADVAFPGSPVLPQTFAEDKTIRLRCHRGIADVYAVPAEEREAGKRQARDADLMDTAPDE
jgi:hypothetical protein